MIPKTTSPLTKGIRTLEGQIVVLSNLVLIIVALLPQGMSWQKSAVYSAILNAVYVISRAHVKATAAKALSPPTPPLGGPVA